MAEQYGRKEFVNMDSDIVEFEENLNLLVEQVIQKLDFKVPAECRRFVERCLRVQDYSVEKGAKLVQNFRLVTTTLHDMWVNYKHSLVEPIISMGIFTVLRSRDELNRVVILSRIGQWNPNLIDFDQLVATMMFFFGWIVGQSAETQRNGVVVIQDLKNFGLDQIRGMKMSRVTQLISMLQYGAPGKIENVHMIFYPRIIWYVYRIVKPFIKEELSRRIHFHEADSTKLHQHFKPEILPLSLGGFLKDEDQAFDFEALRRFSLEDSLHIDILNYGIGRY